MTFDVDQLGLGIADRDQVGESAMILGYAGLLPQIAATATCLFDPALRLGATFAFGYATLILSFLGGIWWGFGMRQSGRSGGRAGGEAGGQGAIAATAVAPPIAAAALILLAISHLVTIGWALALLGCCILLTLLIDRRMTAAGLTPAGWMAMRVPLSVGLGALTIACGALS